MNLILRAEDPAPPKFNWHQSEPHYRKAWLHLYEAITTWFCSSHDFNKDDNIVILYESSLILLLGDRIRYLGPSLRSAASLVYKAFVTLQQMNTEVEESTPGILVYKSAEDYPLPKPYYRLILQESMEKISDVESGMLDSAGSIFTFYTEESQEYYVPASRVAQGLVWFLQERFQ